MTVLCPECGSDITVDLASGQALSHRPKKQPSGGGKNFDELLAGLDESNKRAEEVFQREVSALKDSDRLMEERFREAVKRAEEQSDADLPVRPWDLD